MINSIDAVWMLPAMLDSIKGFISEEHRPMFEDFCKQDIVDIIPADLVFHSKADLRGWLLDKIFIHVTSTSGKVPPEDNGNGRVEFEVAPELKSVFFKYKYRHDVMKGIIVNDTIFWQFTDWTEVDLEKETAEEIVMWNYEVYKGKNK